MSGMPWFDLAVVAVFVASIAVGLLRGLVREVLSLGSWLFAGGLAYLFAPEAAGWFSRWLADPRLQVITAAVAIFLFTLVALGLVSTLLVKLVASVGLKGVDRSLGGAFGVLRALVISAGAVLLLRALHFDQAPWWQAAYLVEFLEPPADMLTLLVDQMVAEFSNPGSEDS